MIGGPFITHHYSPKNRFIGPNVIIIRKEGDPFWTCYDKAKIIYDKVRRLLTTIETWLEYSLDEDIKKQTVLAMRASIAKTLVVASKDVEELITEYQVTKYTDINTIRDVVVQLQEIADEIFNPYIEK